MSKPLEARRKKTFDKKLEGEGTFHTHTDIADIREISVLTSHQYYNTLTAHFAYPSVGDYYYSFP